MTASNAADANNHFGCLVFTAREEVDGIISEKRTINFPENIASDYFLKRYIRGGKADLNSWSLPFDGLNTVHRDR
jgi:hypothetical protein